MSFTANPTTKLTRAIARKHKKNKKSVILAPSNVTYKNIIQIIDGSQIVQVLPFITWLRFNELHLYLEAVIGYKNVQDVWSLLFGKVTSPNKEEYFGSSHAI